MKKFIVTNIILAAWCSQYVMAQQADHEFSVYFGPALSTLNYQLTKGSMSRGAGGDFGIGYTYYRGKERISGTGRVIREDWGIHTGLEFGLYNASAKISGQSDVTGKIDSEGDSFDLYTTLSAYEETQTAILLKIPVMAQIAQNNYFLMAGFKLGIPLTDKFKASSTTLQNEAYYEEWDYWARTQRFAGYGTFDNEASEGKIKLGTCVMLSLEVGAKWRLRRTLSLYTGFYFDYGLNNLTKKSEKEFVNFDYTDKVKPFSTNSVLSVYTEDVKMMACGIKIRVGLVK